MLSVWTAAKRDGSVIASSEMSKKLADGFIMLDDVVVVWQSTVCSSQQHFICLILAWNLMSVDW